MFQLGQTYMKIGPNKVNEMGSEMFSKMETATHTTTQYSTQIPILDFDFETYLKNAHNVALSKFLFCFYIYIYIYVYI